MKARELHQEPITPLDDGKAPTWVVACLDCEFSCDAHGISGDDAVVAIAERHQKGHRLIARQIDYSTGYGRNFDEPHPLYHQ